MHANVSGSSDHIRIVIDVAPGEPIEGTLHEPAGHTSPFRGWLALTALIETARTRQQDQPPPEPSSALPPAAE